MSLLNIQIDPASSFAKAVTELERKNLPFATMQAINATAAQIHYAWRDVAQKVFQNPVRATINAALYRKATKAKLFADIYIRDEASKGTPPSKYLLAQVEGGTRRPKGIERQLTAAGILPAGMFVVPGRGAQLDAFGNLPRGQINQIKSQLGAQSDPLANQTDASRKRRQSRELRKGQRRGDYFAVGKANAGLKPGVYQRISSGFGRAIRSILFFVKRVSYRKRYDILRMGQTIYTRRFPENFKREMAKAVASSWARAGR